MLKIGVFGAGHLGKIHIKCILLQPDVYELVGFFDTSEAVRKKVSEDQDIPAFADATALAQLVDVVDIVTPTITHFELAKLALAQGKHVFIEKPVTHTIEEAEELMAYSRQKNLKIQVGHVERFNPAMLSLEGMQLAPKFIEAHRLANFNPRGTDVSVVLDLMIHDIDIVLNLVQSKVKDVKANGVAILSPTPDIVNARVEFENGCVANLTASRMSLKQMRKVRFFQEDAYVSLDFLEKNAQVVRLYDKGADNVPNLDNLLELETHNGTKLLHIDMPPIESVNAIKMELGAFAQSIQNNTRPTVSIEDGYKALALAVRISKEI